MHYLGSLAWLFDSRCWRLLPLECRRCSEGSLHLGRGQGWMVFPLLGQFGHIFGRLSQISTRKAQLPLECDSTKPIPLPKSLAHLREKNLKKLREGLILLGSLERSVGFFVLFFLFTPQHCPKMFLPGERNCPLRSLGAPMKFIHIHVNTLDAAKSRFPRACLAFRPGEVSPLLIRGAVVTSRGCFREKRSWLWAVKSWAQK